MKASLGLAPKGYQDSFKVLRKSSNYQAQGAVRRALYQTKGFRTEKLSKEKKGKIVRSILDIKQDESLTLASFKSHLISHLIPNFTPVIGLVQHDQYHRYSVDAHLLQAVREVKRIYSHPKQLGKLQVFAEKLRLKDWNILRWGALYHDIAKGQPGDHSSLGKKMVQKDLKAFGFDKDFIDDVSWLVENHLILSTAAFRKNPKSPETQRFLYSRGVRGRRLYLLALFTAVDIRATNPDAWSTWKESLIYELVETLRDPGRVQHFEFVERVQKRLPDIPKDFLENLDGFLFETLSPNTLVKDLEEVLGKEPLPPKVILDKRNQIWVRFHSPMDQSGLLLSYTQQLMGLGCNIRQAFISTHDELGVYDWFRVNTPRGPRALKKLLNHSQPSSETISHALFSQIALVTANDDEWVFSFRAKDQKGLLLAALQAFNDAQITVQWARVHTWGRQIDDVFGILPQTQRNSEEFLTFLRQKLVHKSLDIME